MFIGLDEGQIRAELVYDVFDLVRYFGYALHRCRQGFIVLRCRSQLFLHPGQLLGHGPAAAVERFQAAINRAIQFFGIFQAHGLVLQVHVLTGADPGRLNLLLLKFKQFDLIGLMFLQPLQRLQLLQQRHQRMKNGVHFFTQGHETAELV